MFSVKDLFNNTKLLVSGYRKLLHSSNDGKVKMMSLLSSPDGDLIKVGKFRGVFTRLSKAMKCVIYIILDLRLLNLIKYQFMLES